jgi:hypothetical protein
LSLNPSDTATSIFTNTHALICPDSSNCIVFQYALLEGTGNWLYSSKSGAIIRANALSLLLGSGYIYSRGDVEIVVKTECVELEKASVQQFIDTEINQNR